MSARVNAPNQRSDQAGFVRSVGAAVVDAGHVVRSPALSRWALVLVHADQLVRRAGPISWLLCAFLGMFTALSATEIFSRFGAERGLAGLLIATLGLRELAIVVGTVGIAASAGAGFTTDIGAMAVDGEVDALEVGAVESFPYLVSTRVWATILGSVPLYAGCIAAMFAGGFFAANVQIAGLNSGSYLRFFSAGFAAADVIFALLKGVVAAAVIAVVATGRGFRTRGGPEEVGRAVGEALNVGLVLVMVLNVILSYLLWGVSDPVKL